MIPLHVWLNAESGWSGAEVQASVDEAPQILLIKYSNEYLCLASFYKGFGGSGWVLLIKIWKPGIPFPLKELTCNYVAFEKGNQVIKRVKFTSKDDMIDNPDIFHIEHPVLFGSHGHQDPGSKSYPILGVSH